MKAIALSLLLALIGCDVPRPKSHTHPFEAKIYYYDVDGNACGEIHHEFGDSDWEAMKFAEDFTAMPIKQHFANKDEAIEWMTKNWCKP